MKVSIIKNKGTKETITRHSLEDVTLLITKGWREKRVKNLRQVYHMITTQRQDDGQVLTDLQGGIQLERVCFGQDYDIYRGQRRLLGYNGLVVVEVNGLPSYEKAIETRDQAKKLPETLMCFLGASGKSVKIVCRGELFPDLESAEKDGAPLLPTSEGDIAQFHKNLYQTARKAYANQFGFEIAYLEPGLDRTVYISADPEMYYNPKARPFYADTKPHDMPQPVSISDESDELMPGRTIKRTYRLEWLFIVNNILGRYFELPDEERLETLLMMIATLCMKHGIPLSHAQGMTMEHPVLNGDKLLVKKTFESVYTVSLQEDYMKKHKIKPLQAIPNDTLQMMKTEIFLNENYEMRKNLMTGVAEYREKYSEDQRFKPLTEEVRNDMTMRATELGLKSWDRDVNRFIDSTRIEQ